jgi:hypothetical protein
MSSGDLSAQEVNDLLQRLMTESIKVFASAPIFHSLPRELSRLVSALPAYVKLGER